MKGGGGILRAMTDDEIDFGRNLEDESPWIVFSLLALVIFGIVVEYLL